MTWRECSRFLCLPFLVLVVSGANCPDPDDDDDDAGDRAATDADWEALKAAYSSWIHCCYGEAFGAGGNDYAFAARVDPNAFGLDLDGETVKEAFAALLDGYRDNPNIVLQTEHLDGCIAALEASGCDTSFEECAELIDGIGETGEACAEGLECASERCEVEGDETCGVCAAPLAAGDVCLQVIGEGVYYETCGTELYCNDETGLCDTFVAENGDCSAAGAECDQGLWCSNVSDTCVALPGAGEPCTDDYNCAGDLECDLDTDRLEPTCAAAVPVDDPVAGYSCDPAAATCGFVYTYGLACVPSGETGVCTEIQIVELDGACDGPVTTISPQTRWCRNSFTTTYCDVEVGADEGVCRFLPGPGEPCEQSRCRSDAALCAYTDATFAELECVAVPQEGEPCLDEELAAGARCGQRFSCVTEDGADVCRGYDVFPQQGMCVEP